MIITIDFQESLIDEEMEEYIKQIQKVTEWTKEKTIETSLGTGCKWHIKNNLKLLAEQARKENV